MLDFVDISQLLEYNDCMRNRTQKYVAFQNREEVPESDWGISGNEGL